MRRTVFAVAVLAGSLALPGTARAYVDGKACSSVLDQHPTMRSQWTGLVWGGPMADVDTSGRDATVTLTCSIQVGYYNFLASGPDVVSVSASGPHAAAVPPTPVAFPDDDPYYPGDWVMVCSELAVTDTTGTRHYYYDGGNQVWSTSADVPCPFWAPGYNPPGPVREFPDAVVSIAETYVPQDVRDAVSPPLCVVIGDVEDRWWDCDPPYDPIPLPPDY